MNHILITRFLFGWQDGTEGAWSGLRGGVRIPLQGSEWRDARWKGGNFILGSSLIHSYCRPLLRKSVMDDNGTKSTYHEP